jgi:drug/metabolite transporter (DMT)-like permease
MKIKVVAILAFVLNTLLFGSYYSVAKEVLGRVDPIVFTFFTMMTLVPPALCLIAFSWRHMTREAVKSGFLLGSCLCLGLFTLAVALKYNSATGTAFFPSLNGLLATIFTWLVLRQPIGRASWFAGIVSVIGAVLLMANASIGGARGALIAFIGGLFCTFYIFLADHEQKDQSSYWPLFGVELLTMALWASLIALLFGDWQLVHFSLPEDAGIVLYVGLGTIFLPTLFTVLLQRYISPVTVSFIYILEPILGALVAYFYLHEVLPLDGYLGGGMVVAGVLIHTWGTVERPAQEQAVRRRRVQASKQVQTSLFTALAYPLLCCVIGTFIVYRLGGFPPSSWYELYQLGPQIPGLLQQGQAGEMWLLIAQSVSWLVAWMALIVMGGLAVYRGLDRLFTTSAPPVVLDLDIRTLRQMGYTPYAMPLGQSQAGKDLVQQRRLHRRVRLAHIEPADDYIYEAPTHVPGRRTKVLVQEPQRNQKNGNSTLSDYSTWWEDPGTTEMRKQ